MSNPHLPLDPDPLSVSWVEGYQAGIETRSRRPVLMALIGAALSGAIVGALLTAAIVHASPRTAQLPTVPVPDAGQFGAPLAVTGSALPMEAGDPSNGRESPRQRSAQPERSVALKGAETASGAPTSSGTATWCAPTPAHCQSWGDNAHLGAMRSFGYGDRPYLVTVRSGDRSTVVLVVSHCACPSTLIDLSPSSFSELAPLSRGRIPVTVERGGPSVTPPPTDVTP